MRVLALDWGEVRVGGAISDESGMIAFALEKFIESKDVYIKGAGQVENFQMRTKQAAGVYMIKITDATNKSIFSDKLVIE